MVDQSVLPAVLAALRANEIGNASPYILSYARLGNSGGSFGIFQGDAAADPNARATLVRVLQSAGLAPATVSRIVDAVSRPCPDGSPLSLADQKAADTALDSAGGRAIVDAMDDQILAVILGGLDSCIAAASSVGKHLELGAQLSIALWVNMTGEPTSLIAWLKGQTVGGAHPPSSAGVTRDDLKRYLAGTKFFTLHPKNLIHFEESVDTGLAAGSGANELVAALALPPAASSTATIVQTATAQWDFFGQQTYNQNGHLLHAGHKEGEEGFYQRIGEYWLVGTNTHGIDGRDHDVPWSAAFISWVMKTSGAGANFRYSTQHSVYISQSIRDFLNQRNVGFWGRRLNEYKPRVGDLVCWSRQDGIDYVQQNGGNYAGHCDIVVAVEPDRIFIIGGNVGDSVTRRPLPLVSGFLPGLVLNGETLFAVMQNRLPLTDAVA